MRQRNITTVSMLVLAAMTLTPSYAWAVDTSEWVCEFCPFDDGMDGDVVVGVSTVSDDSAYFGNATGYGESGAYADLDAVGSSVSANQQLSWQAYDLGLDSRSAEFSGGNQGSYQYDLAFREIPREQYYTTETIFLQSGSMLALPPGWVRAPTTSGFTQLSTDLTGRDIESKRKVYEIGGSYLPSSKFKLSANFEKQKNDGLDIYGGSFFTQASLLPGQFDYETNLIDFAVDYALDNGVLTFAYFLSDFSSNETIVGWENPFTSSPGAEMAALSQPPDNKFYQYSLSGSYRFAEQRTVASFSLASGRMTQDQAFLPYTTNPNLVVSPLPRSNLDGKVDTTDFSLTVNSRAINKTLIRVAYRYDDRDNKTPQETWDPVIADTFVSGQSITNLPYSFTRNEVNLSADYDLSDEIELSAGYDWQKLDRTFQEVDSQTDEGGWGGIRWRPNSVYQFELLGGATERDPDNYNVAVGDSFGQNPMMRVYNMAYRYREYAELTASFMPAETPVSVTLNALWADDDYSQTDIGVTSGDDFQLAADVSWTISEAASLYVSGGYQEMKIDQAGSETFSNPDWFAANKDEYYSFGTGFKIRDIVENLDLQLDYTRSDGTSKIDITSAVGANSQFPNLNSTIDYVWLRLACQRSEKLEYAARLGYQSISSDDWALNGVGPATIPVVLSLGADPYNDDTWIFGLDVRYSLGTTKE